MRFSFVVAVVLTACGAGNGGVCQINSDCQSTLVCCKLSTRLEDRGVCRPTGSVCAAPTDGAIVMDANIDGATNVDAAATDTRVESSVSDTTIADTSTSDAPMSADTAVTDAVIASDAASDAVTSDAIASDTAAD